MNNYLKILFVSTSVFMVYAFSINSTTHVSLKAKVNDLRNNRGVVQFALYNKNGSIPDENYEKFYKIKTAKIDKGSAYVTFSDLKPGVYAVNILHDENKNSEIDKGWVLPIEGIGFSNYKTIGLTNRPNFSKASFELKKSAAINIKVVYM
jgi:uncharacterized protein (DUF2141 family)